MPEPQSDNKPLQPLTADAIEDMLNDETDLVRKFPEKEDKDDDKKPIKKPAKDDKEEDPDKKDKDDVIPDEEDIELKDADEVDEEKLDLLKKDDEIEIDAPPRKREVLAKYPNLYKDFPWFEKMQYRDKAYNELFGSFDDAKEAAEKAEAFDEFDSHLVSGNTEKILKSVKENDEKAWDKVVDNYLATLFKVDKDAYHEVTNNVVKQLIAEMAKEAKAAQNEDLQQAAVLLNQFMFGTSTYTPPKVRGTKQDSTEKSPEEKERLEYVQERFDTSRNDLQGKVDNILKNTIGDYIDPKKAMTDYVRKTAVRDALESVGKTIQADSSFMKILDRLWRGAFDARFSQDSLKKIQSAYLGKAKTLLPNAIRKARAEALKDLPYLPAKQEEEEQDEKEDNSTPNKGNLPAGRPAQHRQKANEMKRGESVADFFARD